MKIIEKLCITATVGICAMNVNMSFGAYTDKQCDELKRTSADLIEKVEKERIFSPETMEVIAHQLDNCSKDDWADVKSTFILLCLNCNPWELKKLTPDERKSIFENLKAGKFDNCRRVLENLNKFEEKSLILRKITNTDGPKKFIATVLAIISQNKCITSLYLEENSISCYGAETLAEVLKTNNTSLVSLDLSGNQIGDDGVEALADALRINTFLKNLYLSRNQIGDDGVKALAEALKTDKAKALAETPWDHYRLDLSENQIGDDGVKALAEALKNNNYLGKLNLSHNQIGDIGAKDLAEALTDNRKLKKLYLSYNNIGREGARYFAVAFKIHCHLIKLDLCGNQIGDDGAKDLAEALEYNRELSILLLDSSVGNVGAQAFLNLLDKNKSLSELYLPGDKIDDSIRKRLEAILRE